MAEQLYNGLEIPDLWPPPQAGEPDEPMAPPWLEHPPAVIPIDVGRQLFVDDFLIAESTLERRFHLAEKHDGNPVLVPETELELGAGGFPAAVPKSGGVWWDEEAGVFKMWYEAGWLRHLAYAVSEDGLHWERPELDIEPPSNRIVPELVPDSGTVVVDRECDDPAQRYKMMVRSPEPVVRRAGNRSGNSLVSADGIHWSRPVPTGPMGDRSTMFYNPFRKKWVYSIRALLPGPTRVRRYREHDDFLAGASWTEDETVVWTGADRFDPPDPEIGCRPQLYNLDAVAYESIMLGLFEIHRGPENKVCQEEKRPKITELTTAFSRDGFYWHRPDRRSFIAASRTPQTWDRGYVQSVGGVCLVQGDELWFYYTGFAGDDLARADALGTSSGMYANGSTGVAKLRRDGFASMSADRRSGTLLTRPVVFNGTHLFINAACPKGELTVEVCSPAGDPYAGFAAEECRPMRADSTRAPVAWKGADSLERFAGQPVCFRFHVTNGDLYAFWTSSSTQGQSGGYLGAGSPGTRGVRD